MLRLYYYKKEEEEEVQKMRNIRGVSWRMGYAAHPHCRAAAFSMMPAAGTLRVFARIRVIMYL